MGSAGVRRNKERRGIRRMSSTCANLRRSLSRLRSRLLHVSHLFRSRLQVCNVYMQARTSTGVQFMHVACEIHALPSCSLMRFSLRFTFFNACYRFWDDSFFELFAKSTYGTKTDAVCLSSRWLPPPSWTSFTWFCIYKINLHFQIAVGKKEPNLY